MPKVNSKILRWAREQAELSPQESVEKLNINDTKTRRALDHLEALESGNENPSRTTLLKMGKLYRRPLLTFYMSNPPKKGNRGQDFRTLSHDKLVETEVIVDALLRNICARQRIIRSVLEDEEEVNLLKFIGSKKISDGVDSVLESIRQLLEFDLNSFYNASSPLKAFSLLRAATEKKGIFVILISDLGSYHTAIEPEIFRGFADADNIAPFIAINNIDSQRAWSFTLIHELVHLLLGQTGISGVYSQNKIEKFCNDVAGEFLLPKKIVSSLNISTNTEYDDVMNIISRFADSNNLSYSMVSYNLYRYSMISRSVWERLETQFKAYWQKSRIDRRIKARELESGPSYYVVRKQHIGNALINLVQRMMAASALTTTQSGQVLGVKAKNVQKLIYA
jgi:Zn-dependent peptidase ImmA (M78 family)